MSLNGKLYYTTYNVLRAILTCQLGEPTYLWIDAICINQTDRNEKSQQVPRMDSIYSKATQVFICLGDHVKDIDALHSLLYQLEEEYLDQKLSEVNQDKTWFLHASSSTIEAPHWIALVDFYKSPWFFRLWVIQELALARHVLFYSNGHSFRLLGVVLGYTALKAGILREMQAKGILPHDASSFLGDMNSLSNVRNAYRDSTISGSPPSLSTIWYERIDASSTDRRDYVYGLLGLGFKHAIVPDYSKSEVQVFADAIAFCLQQDQNYSVLSLAGITPQADGSVRPSWFPMFSVRRRPHRYAFEVPPRFHAGGKRAGSRLEKQFKFEGPALVINGIVADRIRKTSSILRGMNLGAPWDETLNDWVDEVLKICGETQIFDANAGEASEKLARTLLTGAWYRTRTEQDQDMHKHSRFSTAFEAMQKSYLELPAKHGFRSQVSRDPALGWNQEDLGTEYWKMVNHLARYRRFATTTKGDLALVPVTTQADDLICVFPGGNVPLIIREMASGVSQYQLVGEAYVDDLMYGQGLEMGPLQEIVLL